MQTIALDITPLLEKNWGGVSWFTYHIIQGLVDDAARGQLRVVLFYNQRKLLRGKIVALLEKWRNAPNVCIAGYRMPNRLLNVSMRFLKFPYIDELLANHLELRINGFDYFLLPNLSFISLSLKTPYIAVCHDLSWETFPEFFTIRQRIWHRLINPRRFYKNAARVIAVSKNTKQDLVDLYGIDPTCIDVVYPGIDHSVFYPRDDTRAVRKKYGLPENFILSVGTLEPRKNYETLLEAFDMLCEKTSPNPSFVRRGGDAGSGSPPYEGPPALFAQSERAGGARGGLQNFHLLIVGAEGWKFDRIYRFWNRMKHKARVRFLFNVSREDLPFLYSAARLFIYPSFYEGFGFPPLEAVSCGTPVIVGHGSSLPEVMGDAALYVDPFNIADVARAMERVLSDDKLCDRLREKGLQRALDFRWERSISKVISLVYLRLNSTPL